LHKALARCQPNGTGAVEVPVLVSELLMPRPLAAVELQRLHIALRGLGHSISRCCSNLAVPLGALADVESPQHPFPVLLAFDAGNPLPLGLRAVQHLLDTFPGLETRLAVARGVTQELVTLHRTGVCHGSLASRCILVGEDCQGALVIRIVEAGVAKALRSAGPGAGGE